MKHRVVVSKLLKIHCANVNSASYPQWNGKWVVAHGIQGLLYKITAVACLLAALRVQLFTGNGWSGSVMPEPTSKIKS